MERMSPPKKFSKNLNAMQRKLAEYEFLYRGLERTIKTMKPGPEKRRCELQLQWVADRLRDPFEREELCPERLNRTSAYWLTEAEFQKSLMRKFQRAGDARRAR